MSSRLTVGLSLWATDNAECVWRKTIEQNYCKNRIHLGNYSDDGKCGAAVNSNARCSPNIMQRDHWSQFCSCVPAGSDCDVHSGDSDLWTCSPSPTPAPAPVPAPVPMPA